jgi:hypothetical protein
MGLSAILKGAALLPSVSSRCGRLPLGLRIGLWEARDNADFLKKGRRVTTRYHKLDLQRQLSTNLFQGVKGSL